MKFFGPHRPERVLLRRNTLYIATEFQPDGWRFVPDTILPGYQCAPQWVLARTPMVHGGPYAGSPWVGQQTSTTRQDQENDETQATASHSWKQIS